MKFKFLRSPFRRTVLPAFRARFSLDLKNWAKIWGMNQSIADKNSSMENHLDAITQSIDSWSCDQCNVEKSIANDIEDSIEKQVHAKLIRDRGMWLTSDLLQPPLLEFAVTCICPNIHPFFCSFSIQKPIVSVCRYIPNIHCIVCLVSIIPSVEICEFICLFSVHCCPN